MKELETCDLEKPLSLDDHDCPEGGAVGRRTAVSLSLQVATLGEVEGGTEHRTRGKVDVTYGHQGYGANCRCSPSGSRTLNPWEKQVCAQEEIETFLTTSERRRPQTELVSRKLKQHEH